jgi:nucleotide-binding universal stress UspA family protein
MLNQARTHSLRRSARSACRSRGRFDRPTTLGLVPDLVRLFHVWSVPTPSYAEALSWPIDSIEAAAKDALGRAHARLKEKHPNADAVLAAGVAWDRIIEAARERDVDMIVMGTHGRRGVPRWFLGSVAEKVVRLSPVPVLTVGAEKS